MDILIVLLTSLSLLAAIFTFLRTHGHKNVNKNLNTPPGSTGWPIIGETIQFGAPHPSTSLGDFMETRIKRYGKVFKTNVLGNPTIMSADLEFNQFVLQNDGKLFEHNWPTTFQRLLGNTLPALSVGETHRCLKNIFHFFLGIPNLQKNFLGTFERYTLDAIGGWKVDVPFPLEEVAKKITFYMILGSMLSLKPGERNMEELWRAYHVLSEGFGAVPLYLPGTNFTKAIKSRKVIVKIIGGLAEERNKKRLIGCDEVGESDYLGLLLERSNLDIEHLVNHIIGMLFAGYATSSTALSMAIYFLGGCPKAIQQLKEEHQKIAKTKKKRGESRLTWEDIKCMEFTHCVINETLRLGNVSSQIYRKAKIDTQFKGYDIPRGWNVIPVLAASHLETTTFEGAHTFNPWRWQQYQDTSTSTRMAQGFMPFSQGVHKCAGVDLTKMELAVFMHHLVIRFDWEVVDGGNPMWCFGSHRFPKGLLLKVRRVSDD